MIINLLFCIFFSLLNSMFSFTERVVLEVRFRIGFYRSCLIDETIALEMA